MGGFWGIDTLWTREDLINFGRLGLLHLLLISDVSVLNAL